ncbi:protein DOWNSTREAM OF FLC-like [Cynara cardunculus var. scolymus]|uniref:Pollen Ole e 1 allergen/extensin n=1 Tax=Cynara cardunculus var. scolymus TaxID=59895 RepID=A0A103XBC9_CYNCS|nr:protein DOWNSTREAM OF FLC-like [Cynara cardunculus var. scolymus]KVH87584.1 Pollen Ole e 1 allergen/extensin [Cynara cardunculus var. scolymus]
MARDQISLCSSTYRFRPLFSPSTPSLYNQSYIHSFHRSFNPSTMAKLLVFLALSLLPLLSTATVDAGNPFRLKGRVYCDTCRCGFETSVTKYLAGAKVKVECRDRSSMNLRYTLDAVTDATGTYEMEVKTDHGDQKCECTLVSSPDPECAEPNIGRDRATVILTRNNGMRYDARYANSMGFMKKTELAGCTELVRSYFAEDV